MNDVDRAVRVVIEVQAQEASHVAVQGYIIMLANVRDNRVDVGLGVTEDDDVDDIDDDARCFCLLRWCERRSKYSALSLGRDG